MTVITDTCLKSDSLAKHSEILNSHWAVGTAIMWRLEIHRSHGGGDRHRQPVIYHLLRQEPGWAAPFGSCGLPVWEGLAEMAHHSLQSSSRGRPLLCPALPPGPVTQGQFSLVHGPFSGGPASVRPLFRAGIARGIKENKKMSHLTKDLDFPRLQEEHLQPPHPPAPQGNWRSREEIHLP